MIKEVAVSDRGFRRALLLAVELLLVIVDGLKTQEGPAQIWAGPLARLLRVLACWLRRVR